MKEKPKYNFSGDGNNRYSTYPMKDPYKIALLQCMGVKIVERNPSDPKNIVFILEHENIVEFVKSIHEGRTGEYLKEDAEAYMKYHKDIMDYIRDQRLVCKVNVGGA